MKKTSIIILSYNSLEETTKPCIESIYKARTDIPFETIVVDNLSTDGTRDYLLSIYNKYKNFRFILNDKNYGFAGGNNIGIRSADGDYYILLNSDTIVTDYWLDRIVDFFKTHPEVSMAGPVSNSVGNEQCIYIEGKTEEEIIREGLVWTEKCRNNFFYTSMLGFFCVVIKREVIEKVGFLNEDYGLGMFEDDDYCIRVIQYGYKLACIEDVFVYHKGSISFNKLGDKSDKIFYENLKKFENKFNTKWKSHYNTHTFISLILHYLDSDKPEIKDKIRNKLKLMLENFDYASKNMECIHFWKECIKKDEEIRELRKAFSEASEEKNIMTQNIERLTEEKEVLKQAQEKLLLQIKTAQTTKTWKLMSFIRRINEELFKGSFQKKLNFFRWIKGKIFRETTAEELALVNFSPINIQKWPEETGMEQKQDISPGLFTSIS